MTQEEQGRLIVAFLDDVRPMACSYAASTGIDTDDLLQDVAVRLLRYWDRIVGSGYSSAYVNLVAQNVFKYHYLKLARRRRIAPMLDLEVAKGAW